MMQNDTVIITVVAERMTSSMTTTQQRRQIHDDNQPSDYRIKKCVLEKNTLMTCSSQVRITTTRYDAERYSDNNSCC
jgi:hypothetical protein